MNEVWKEVFLGWSQTEEFQNKVEEAKAIIRDAIKKCNPYTTFSGGKDSLVVSHIARSIEPDILVIHLDYGEELIPRDFYREILQIMEKNDFNYQIIKHWIFEEKGKGAIGVMDIVLRDIANEMLKRGYDGVFVGLRSEEAVRRKQRIKYNISITSIQEFYPIGNWKWIDVWSYIVSRELEYLSYYDKLVEVVGYENARFTTIFDPEFDKFGNSNIEGVIIPQYRYLKK
ncbi:MAG: phosphoadenosine phosphosulfate reductase family protein [Ignavibacteria bacterium]|nr:phosphoadenosine phosphosulfate reductase family protein [Ignavibacteria bacterium]